LDRSRRRGRSRRIDSSPGLKSNVQDGNRCEEEE
jgi:hypothetical protein